MRPLGGRWLVPAGNGRKPAPLAPERCRGLSPQEPGANTGDTGKRQPFPRVGSTESLFPGPLGPLTAWSKVTTSSLGGAHLGTQDLPGLLLGHPPWPPQKGPGKAEFGVLVLAPVFGPWLQEGATLPLCPSLAVSPAPRGPLMTVPTRGPPPSRKALQTRSSAGLEGRDRAAPTTRPWHVFSSGNLHRQLRAAERGFPKLGTMRGSCISGLDDISEAPWTKHPSGSEQ